MAFKVYFLQFYDSPDRRKGGRLLVYIFAIFSVSQHFFLVSSVFLVNFIYTFLLQKLPCLESHNSRLESCDPKQGNFSVEYYNF